MNEVFYLEADEEITGVIDRIRKSPSRGVVFVVPRGGTIGQSIINLRLLKRSAEELDKSIGLVSSDKVTANLAKQVGVPFFEKVKEAEAATLTSKSEPKKADKEMPVAVPVGSGLKVNTYQKYSETEGQSDQVAESEEQENTIEQEPEPEIPSAVVDEETQVAEEQSGGVTEEEEQDANEEIEEEPGPEQKHESKERDEMIVEKPVSAVAKRHIRTEGSRRTILIFTAIILILVLGFSYFFLPFAEASIMLKTVDEKDSFDITINTNQKDADVANAVLPGQLQALQKEETKSYPATGTKDIGNKAAGKITVSNLYSTDTYSLPIGSRFSASGKVFVSTAAVTVPGETISKPAGVTIETPGTADVTVQAENPGDSYNIAPSSFTIISLSSLPQGKVTGKSSAAMTGGTTQQLKLVAATDLSGAQSDLQATLTTDATNELQSTADTSGLKILADQIKSEVISSSADKKAGDQADSFNQTMDIKVSTIGFAEAAFRDLVLSMVTVKITDQQMIIKPETADVTYTVKSSDVGTGTLVLAVNFSGKIGQKLSINAVKSALRNKKIAVAQSYLSNLDGADSATLVITPKFWKMLPILTSRIRVNFDYQR